jgi:hypothetical protein
VEGVSSQQQPSPPASQVAAAGGRQVYRSAPAVVLWWGWLVFAVANVVDITLQGHGHFAAVVVAVIVLITGVMYACALWPRVVSDDAGITLANPLRQHHVPWAAVTTVDLRDTLEIRCQRPGGRDKVLHSWAVQSSRRSRARAELRTRRGGLLGRTPSPSYAKLPREAKELMRKSAAELAAAQLSGRAAAEQARAQAMAAATVTVRWAWGPIAAIALPAIALAVVAAR